MFLTESIVEDAALTWIGESGYAVGDGPQLAPGEPAAERDSFGEVVLAGRLREALRQLNPAILQSRNLAHPARHAAAEAAERGVERGG